jgi:hypothetical protein
MNPAYGQMLWLGWRQRRNQHGLRSSALLAVFIAALVAAALVWPGRWADIVLALVPGLLLAGTWAGWTLTLLYQNQPQIARLVPGHVQHLRWGLCAGWLLASLLCTALAMASGAPAGRAWTLSALGTALLAAMMRWPLLWLLTWLGPMAGIWLFKNDLLPPLLDWYAGHALLCAAAITLIAPLALTQLLGEGGEHHRRAYHRNRQWQQALRKAQAGQRVLPHEQGFAPFRWLARLAQWPYFAWLRRQVDRPSQANTLARLCLGIGPNAHWIGQVGGLLVFLAVMAAVAAVVLVFGATRADAFLSSAIWGLSIGIMNFATGQTLGLRGALYQTRREQALLMQMPGLPRGAALNRRLGLRHGLQFLAAWLLASAVLLVMTTGHWTQTPALLYCLATLSVAALLWGHWAAIPPVSMQQQMAPMALPVLLAGLAWAAHSQLAVPLPALEAGLVLLALAAGWWRWRIQRDAPCMLPAGRLFQAR